MRFSTSLALAALGLAASALPAAAGTLLVPQQYPTIQKALNAAKPYDTVLVSPKSGGAAYSEAVTISTPHIVLQGSRNPIIDGTALATIVAPFPSVPSYTYMASPNAIQIRADHVVVRGLTVQNFGYGDDANGPASAVSVGYYSADGSTEYSAGDLEISGCAFRHNYQAVMIDGFAGPNPNYGPGGANLKGYRLLGNTVTDNSGGGGFLNGDAAQVTGNTFLGNGGDGLDVTGTGVTVAGNEAGNNLGDGLSVVTALYNPAVNDPKNPNPAPALTALNYVHDNGGPGIALGGTQTVAGNAVIGNTAYGIRLDYADFSTISGNLISSTQLAQYTTDAGTGIYVEFSALTSGTLDSGLMISANQISGNAGDGIYVNESAGGSIADNNVTGNQGIGIHVSDYATSYGGAPTTVTRNRAQHNIVFDARDDASAADNITYNGELYYGDGATTINVWTKNLFGTADPVGLGK